MSLVLNKLDKKLTTLLTNAALYGTYNGAELTVALNRLDVVSPCRCIVEACDVYLVTVAVRYTHARAV